MELGKNPEKHGPASRDHLSTGLVWAWGSSSICLAPTGLPLALAEKSEYCCYAGKE